MYIKGISYDFRDRDNIELYGIGDAHIGSQQHNRKAFQRVIDEILSQDNRYCVVLGDLIDNGIEGSKTGAYDQNGDPDEQIEEVEKLILPLAEAGRILGWTGGNHERRTSKVAGIDISKNMAKDLGVLSVYRRGLCPLFLSVGKRKNGHVQSPVYAVGITHGSGGGTTLGAGLTKAEKFALANGFDAVIMGHSHKPADAPSMRFYPDYNSKCMVGKVIRIMVCSGYLDYGGYPIDAMYSPVAIKPNKMIFSGDEYNIDVLS